MTEWSETTLRSAANWKAFKEGKSLFENGAVSGAKSVEGLISGIVKEGKRAFKAAVKIISSTNLETRCSCPLNQSTGELCPHGVAVGLAILKGGGPAAGATKAASPVISKIEAFQISLPLNWEESLGKGRLSASLTAGGEISAADERLSNWLATAGVAVKFPLQLNLDPEQSGAFLKILTEHPRVQVGKSGQAVEINEGGRVRIDRLNREADQVRLETTDSTPIKIAGNWWQISSGLISRIGTGVPGAALSKLLESLCQNGSVQIPIATFLENLERWQEWLDFPKASWLDSIHFVPARASFELALEGSLQRLEATLRVRYGVTAPVVPGLGTVTGLPNLAGDLCEIRDLAGEQSAVERMLLNAFQAIDLGAGKFELRGEPAILNFISRDLPRMKTEWQVMEGVQFKASSNQVSVIEPSIEILGSGEDWLSFDIRFQSNDGSVISSAEVRRLLSGGKSGSGKRIVISDSVSNLIEPMFADLELKQEGGHFVTSKRAGEVIKEIRNKLSNGFNSSELTIMNNFDYSSLITANMRSYQTIGSNWLHDRIDKFGGALLADDMGLGKTIQTIACVERLFDQGHEDSGTILVVATASLLGNWKAEFAKFAPGRAVRILHGSGREKQQQQVAEGEVLLTTFGTLPRDLAWYLKQKFKAIIVDEASLMRNPDTDHAKAISKLSAGARIALTGTPIENGVRDLWSIFRFIQPGWLGGREEFREKYELNADAKSMARLRLKTSPFMLRRTKEEVAPELPSKIFIEEYCELTTEQQSVYKDLLVEGRRKVESLQDSKNSGAARMQVLTALLRLRQTCCDLALLGGDRFNQMLVAKRSSKLLRLMELVDEAVSGNHKILVFSQFQTQLREIEKCLIERGIDNLKLDGQTKKRQELVDRFQSASGPPVFLISLKAGGYGLNLTAADIVVHFDPWWNPAAEAQATDRAHRIGQTRPVTVYRLITRGTVEEKVVSLQNKKRQIASAIDESGGGEAGGWSETELMDLMK